MLIGKKQKYKHHQQLIIFFQFIFEKKLVNLLKKEEDA